MSRNQSAEILSFRSYKTKGASILVWKPTVSSLVNPKLTLRLVISCGRDLAFNHPPEGRRWYEAIKDLLTVAACLVEDEVSQIE